MSANYIYNFTIDLIDIRSRWEKYAPVGCRVPGTRFIPFKVPLKMVSILINLNIFKNILSQHNVIILIKLT